MTYFLPADEQDEFNLLPWITLSHIRAMQISKKIVKLMKYHEIYAERFCKAHFTLLHGEGPLPAEYRIIIAIIAAGRHQCCCIMNMLKAKYLQLGYDPSWLLNLDAIPPKIRRLSEINKILAHRPWLLNEAHVKHITTGADSWSMSELMYAIILMAHFHSLPTFLFACGLQTVDAIGNHNCDVFQTTKLADNASTNSPPVFSEISSSADSGPETMPPLPALLGDDLAELQTLLAKTRYLAGRCDITQEELSKRFEMVEKQSAELDKALERCNPVLRTDIALFIEDSDYIYEDVNRWDQKRQVPIFRINEYSWSDHGYSFVRDLDQELGSQLDEKFRTIYGLTYRTMGPYKGVDTIAFRVAIWNYIQCLYGMRHDDYDYQEINELLDRDFRTFIKSAVCYPERLDPEDCDRVMSGFRQAEKIHVNAIMLEARVQAELLYALRVLTGFKT